ncbi:hypothetical protein [Staphylococcus haemolyticus]|uniref:hypothetical protein n=1 Tax=Staphylococcus haemolyticus TaxID=1283 RepID=UPI001E2F9C2F|nr:hypothetical protein [Staphylococcus haemolyticus]MCC3722524.1 hypothetical protein [Staphylococcus haemolyticus]
MAEIIPSGPALAPLRLVAYDPHKLHLFLGGERVSGFLPHRKISLRRGLNGTFEMEIFLGGTSSWVPKLRQLLGYEMPISIQYPNEFADALGFEDIGVLSGFDLHFTNEVPEVVFYFKNKD